MAAVSTPAAVARVFISCPGDLADQRGVVSQAAQCALWSAVSGRQIYSDWRHFLRHSARLIEG